MTARKGLGRGIGSLISDKQAVPPTELPEAAAPPAPPDGPRLQQVPLDHIRRNPRQPRERFDQERLQELAASITKHGVLQPLLVRSIEPGVYELIAGERRLRAAGLAHLQEVPVCVVDANDRDSMEMTIIENLQRENLNPIEEADGYRELADSFDLTQEEIADRVGRSRAAVANALRLLTLPDEVCHLLKEQKLSSGHAKVLLSLSIPEEQVLLARRVLEEGLSVRNLEKIVKRMMSPATKPRASRPDVPVSHTRELSEKLHQHFGTSVRLFPCRTFSNGKKGKGKIEIDFFSNQDLERVLTLLGLDLEQ